MNYCPFLESIYRHIDTLIKPEFFTAKDSFYACLGALIGSGIALCISSILRTRKTNKDKKSAKEALIDRLKFNNDRALQMLRQFNDIKETPNYLFDTTGVIIWLSLSSKVFSKQLIEEINWHRYQLDHLNSKLSTYYLFMANYHPLMMKDQYYQGVHKAREERARQSILLQLKEVSAAFLPLIQEIDKNPEIFHIQQ